MHSSVPTDRKRAVVRCGIDVRLAGETDQDRTGRAASRVCDTGRDHECVSGLHHDLEQIVADLLLELPLDFACDDQKELVVVRVEMATEDHRALVGQ